jgi:DNA-binding transcriptional LysR family regulator
MAPPPSPSLPPPSPSDDALRLPSLDALRAFEAAARLGSYERAAEALHITASAVGKRVATLEEQLGLTLFQRGSKPLQLSASGREYLAAIWPALEQLARVPQHQRGAQRGQRLRLSAPPTLAREVLVPALPAFAEQHPDIELELVLSVPFLDQGGSDADLDVRHGQALRTDDRPLMQDVLIPLASPALLPDGPLRQPGDLARLPLLRNPLEPWTPWFRAVGWTGPSPNRVPGCSTWACGWRPPCAARAWCCPPQPGPRRPAGRPAAPGAGRRGHALADGTQRLLAAAPRGAAGPAGRRRLAARGL